MNFLIRLFGAYLSRRIEAGSSRGAFAGAILGGVVLGGLGVAGWVTGYTGFMGAGFTLAGLVVGAIAGGLTGSAIGPEDRLLHTENQRTVQLTDYNRKLVWVVPIAICLALSAGAGWLLWQDKANPELKADDRGALQLALGGGVVGAVVSSVILSTLVISVTLGDDIRVNKLLKHRTFAYSDILGWHLYPSTRTHSTVKGGGTFLFVMNLPNLKVSMPVNGRQAKELSLLLDGIGPSQQ